MSGEFHINGKRFCAATDLAGEFPYTYNDIVALAQSGSITATQMEQQWFVNVESLVAYMDSCSVEKEVRAQLQATSLQQTELVRDVVLRRRETYLRRANRIKTRALFMATALCCLGFLVGGIIYTAPDQQALFATITQINNVLPGQLVGLVSGTGDESRSVTENDITAPVVTSLYSGEQTGILLLPQGVATSTQVEQLFSDRVQLTQLPSGRSVVTQVNAMGEMVGPSIPYVVVPVNTVTTTSDR